jgi:hypothetical protein
MAIDEGTPSRTLIDEATPLSTVNDEGGRGANLNY